MAPPMSVREQYDLPSRPPIPWRVLILVGVVTLVALGLWRFGPDSAALVVVVFLVVIGAVFFGVFSIITSRRLEEPPGGMPPHRAGPGREGSTGDPVDRPPD